MPVVLLDRLPLPSLPAYTAVSVALLACSLYYAAQNAAFSEVPTELQASTAIIEDQDNQFEGFRALCWNFGRRCTTVLAFMIHEPFCIWPLVNMAYCIVVLLGKCIQGLVFGELRVSESQAMKDTFWNFVFYKFIFVFGVLSVQRLEEVVLWCSWFTMLGFLHHLAQLARERAEYLSLSGSPGRERVRHFRLLALLTAIVLASGAMMLVCAAVGVFISGNTCAFMAVECILLFLRTFQTMVRYSLHLYDVHSTPSSPVHSGTTIYNVSLPKKSTSSIPTENKRKLSIDPSELIKSLSNKRDDLNKSRSDLNISSCKDDVESKVEGTLTVNSQIPVLSSGDKNEIIDNNMQENIDLSQTNNVEVNESSLENQETSSDSNASHTSSSSQRGWFRGGSASYYFELFFELGALLLDLGHHIHMLLWCNILLSMASLVICMQLRLLLHQLRARLARHNHRLKLQAYMRTHFPLANEAELRGMAEDCAICWERLDTARKLPCSHLFHTWCLQSWLEQDASCPTCRMPLAIGDPGPNSGNRSSPGVVGLLGNALGGLVGRDRDQDEREQEPLDQQQQINNNSNVFHFDGSRYVSWLPSFSVEAAHTQLVQAGEIHPSSQLNNMALQVQQMFPHFPLWMLVADLRVSHSAELTVENILEGRLLPPAPMFNPDVMELTPQPQLTPQHSSSNWNEIDEPDEVASFSQVSSERQRTLARRREALVNQARRRYLEKSKLTSQGGPSCSHNLGTDATSSSL